MSDAPKRLLIAVVNDPEKLDEILAGYLEVGVTGATVIDRSASRRWSPTPTQYGDRKRGMLLAPIAINETVGPNLFRHALGRDAESPRAGSKQANPITLHA